MAAESKLIEISQWPGQFSDADPLTIPPGAAQDQINMMSLVPGELSCRKGLQPIANANSITSTTNEIIEMFWYQRCGSPEIIVYQDSAGNIKAAGGIS